MHSPDEEKARAFHKNCGFGKSSRSAALHEICRQAGLAPESPECHDAAAFIMRLYWNGHRRTAGELEAALFAYLEAA